MKLALTRMVCASALGRDVEEMRQSYSLGNAPGMKMIVGDIPGRDVFFGSVLGDLPEVSISRFNFRSCRLVRHALNSFGNSLEEFVNRYGADRIAVVLGASNTGIDEAERYYGKWRNVGIKPAEFDFSMIELGSVAEYLAAEVGITGPAYVISTACSSSAKAFAAARRLIECSVVDAAIVGGADSRCRFAMNGFNALEALSAGRCRPLAVDRDGINLGEGVALFTMERGEGPVYFAGAGECSDAYHITAPDPEGIGAEHAMRLALKDAGLKIEDVEYLNLHGTGTVANDEMEMKAVRRIFGEQLPKYESTKALTGHCLGAAGAVEAAICWMKIADGEIRSALSNSFAFGGSNASVAFIA